MSRVMLTTFLIFAVGDVSSIGDFDLLKYAITQGGLLIVVVLLLWSYRKDLKSQRELDATKARQQIERQDEKISILTGLVATNTQAMTRSVLASEAQEKAAHRLSRALDRFEERQRS